MRKIFSNLIFHVILTITSLVNQIRYLSVNKAYVCIVYYRSAVAFAFPSAAGSFSSIALPSKKTKVRKNFPETWLWQTLDAG